MSSTSDVDANVPDLNHLRAVAEAATPGSWRHHRAEFRDSITHSVKQDDVVLAFVGYEEREEGRCVADADHMATFDPQTVLWMLDRLAQYETWLRETTVQEWATACHLDHDGDCQAHGYFDGPCPIPQIQAALTAAPDVVAAS